MSSAARSEITASRVTGEYLYAYVLSVQLQIPSSPGSLEYLTEWGTITVREGDSRLRILEQLLGKLREKASDASARSDVVILCFSLEKEILG